MEVSGRTIEYAILFNKNILRRTDKKYKNPPKYKNGENNILE